MIGLIVTNVIAVGSLVVLYLVRGHDNPPPVGVAVLIGLGAAFIGIAVDLWLKRKV